MSWTITPQTKVPVDPQFGSVSLLLHGNGANGSTTITDSSPTPKTITAVGNAQISTAQSKFGGSSIAFVNSAGDRLTIPASNALALGAGDFTLEGWFYPTSFAISLAAIVDYRNTGGVQTNFPIVYFNTDGTITFNSILSSSSSVPLNSWTHIAFVRSAGILTVYIGGQSKGSVSTSADFGCNAFTCGALVNNPSVNYYRGYIDELRISRVARYTSNFAPPIAPFPDI